MNGDVAIVKKLPSFYGSDEGEVIRVLQHKTNTLVGTFFSSPGKGLQLRLDDERIKARLIVKNWQAFKMVSGTKVLLKVLRYGDPMELEIVQLLGHIDDPGVVFCRCCWNTISTRSSRRKSWNRRSGRRRAYRRKKKKAAATALGK